MCMQWFFFLSYKQYSCPYRLFNWAVYIGRIFLQDKHLDTQETAAGNLFTAFSNTCCGAHDLQSPSSSGNEKWHNKYHFRPLLSAVMTDLFITQNASLLNIFSYSLSSWSVKSHHRLWDMKDYGLPIAIEQSKGMCRFCRAKTKEDKMNAKKKFKKME